MSILLPRVLKNMNLFVDGRGHAGHVDEITLPVLSIATEDHRAGGMDLPVELDMGMEKLEATMVLSDYNPDIIRQFGLLVNAAVQITVRGAIQAQGHEAEPVVVKMTGGFKQLDSGGWTPGQKNALTVGASLVYYHLVINEEELVEIDAINMVRRINGVDQLAGQRTAIGL